MKRSQRFALPGIAGSFGWVMGMTFALFSPSVNAGLLVVNLTGTGDFKNIQSAIDAAADGDTVRVARGTYIITQPISFKGKAIAVRSESGPAATTIRMAATPANPDRASVLIFEGGETQASVLEGFTVTGGKGTLVDWPHEGGGIFCRSGSSPTITQCKVSGNENGGIRSRDSSPTLIRCTVSGNSSGGIYCVGQPGPTVVECTVSANTNPHFHGLDCHDSSPTVRDCTISGNAGGGIACYGSTARGTFSGCLIARNAVDGGISCYGGARPSVVDCTITENSASSLGGGINCDDGSPTIVNCSISRNHAGWAGGGARLYNGSSPTFTKCAIWGNFADKYGGGIYSFDRCAPRLTNCTIWGNKAETGGGVYSEQASSPGLMNCTIASNTQSAVSCQAPASATLTNCILWGNSPNTWCGTASSCLGNSDPRFVDPGSFDFERVTATQMGTEWIDMPDFVLSMPDYHLLPDTPAANAGTSSGATAVDFDDNPRPCAGGVDIGAYESCEGAECVGGTLTYATTGCVGEELCVLVEPATEGQEQEVAVQRSGGTWAVVGKAAQSTFCFTPEKAGTYRFRFREYCDPKPGQWTIGPDVMVEGKLDPSTFLDHETCLPEDGLLRISWFAVEGAEEYRVEAQVDGGEWYEISSTTDPSFEYTIPDRAQRYTFRVAACDACGCGEWRIGETAAHCPVGSLRVTIDPAAAISAGARWRIDGGPWLESGHTENGVPAGERVIEFKDISLWQRPADQDVSLAEGHVVEIGGVYEKLRGLFQRGDANADGAKDISDAVTILGFLFLGNPMNDCRDAADVNDDAKVDISDAVSLLGHLFLGSGRPPDPFGACGPDPTGDGLECEMFGICQ